MNADPAGTMFLICPGIPALLVILWYVGHILTDHYADDAPPQSTNANRLHWPFDAQP